MSWKLEYTKQARKDAKKVTASAKPKLLTLLQTIEDNPFANPPKYEALVGTLQGAYSRRITIQHRLVYSVNKRTKTTRVLRVSTHYE